MDLTCIINIGFLVTIHRIGLSSISMTRAAYWRIPTSKGYWFALAATDVILGCASVISLHEISQLEPPLLFQTLAVRYSLEFCSTWVQPICSCERREIFHAKPCLFPGSNSTRNPLLLFTYRSLSLQSNSFAQPLPRCPQYFWPPFQQWPVLTWSLGV